MARFSLIIMGILFTAIGLILALMVADLSMRGDVEMLLGLPVVIVMLLSGCICLTVFAYQALCDQTGVQLHFAFRNVHIPWKWIESYRSLGVRGRLKGGAYVWALLKYRTVGDGRTHYRYVLLFLEGKGPAVSLSKEDYTTELGERVRQHELDERDNDRGNHLGMLRGRS